MNADDDCGGDDDDDDDSDGVDVKVGNNLKEITEIKFNI